ncbi:MAG: amidase family protein [Pseudomonadota bacterium]
MSSEIETLATKSASEIGRSIARGATDPRELTEFYLERAGEKPDIYARLTADRARAAARASKARADVGMMRGPLDGVPTSWKDLIDFAGVPTEAGSQLRKGYTPDRDAIVAARGERAGLIPLGKTHLSELAFSGLGYNPMTATAPNPFDSARVPGGSSSGAAASVSFGAAGLAVGSDTGGSVRIPAAWQGLVGLKTTHGLIPNDGVTPLSPSLDTIGPLTRTVEDAAFAYSVLADRKTPDLTGASLKGSRFFAPETIVLDDMDPDLRAAFDAAVDMLREQGATVDFGPAPELAEALDVAASHGAIVNTEGYAVWGEAIEADPEAIYPLIRERFRSGGNYSAPQIEFARLKFQTLSRVFQARIAAYDAALCPTTPKHAPKIADIEASEETYVAENLLALRNTRLGNLLALCGLTIPTGKTASGLPSALLLTGRPFNEPALLRAGAAIEAAFAR